MYYRQPRYYANFHCLGGTCANSCCCGWRIDWNKEEVDKLVNAKGISPELKELAEKTFIPSTNRSFDFMIKFKEDLSCPFLTGEKLCKIQKELGADYLSQGCRDYPRVTVYSEGRCYSSCRMSCPEIIKALYNDERCMELITVEGPDMAQVSNRPEEDEKYPEQEYRADIFELLYELISDKSIDVDRAVMLGAIAAERVTQAVERKDYGSIPEEISILRVQLRNDETLKVVNNVEPNLSVKLSVLPAITEQIVIDTVTYLLHPNGEYIDLEAYNSGAERFNEVLKEHGHFLRNMALSLLLVLDVPFKFSEYSVFENYCYFAAAYACLKLNIISAMSADSIDLELLGQHFMYEETDEKIIGLTSAISRELCQSDINFKKIIDFLKEKGFVNHAYLAAFIL